MFCFFQTIVHSLCENIVFSDLYFICSDFCFASLASLKTKTDWLFHFIALQLTQTQHFKWKTLFTPQSFECFLQSMHRVGLIQFIGLYVPLVHCGIMQSDLLHIKSCAFEGFWDFVFWKRSAQHVLPPKTRFISRYSSGILTRWFIRNWFNIDHKVVIVRVFWLVETHLCACCAGTIPINHNASAPHIFLWVLSCCIVCCVFRLSVRTKQQQNSPQTKQGQSRCWLTVYANKSICRHEDKWIPICEISVMYLYL